MRYSNLTIRPITQTDIKAVYDIECRAHSHPWSLSILTDSLSNKHRFGFVAEDRSTLVGFFFISNVAQEAELLDIAVDPNEQGKGYGKQLLECVIDQAQQKGAESIFLEVRESNKAAINLYETMGFNEVGRRRRYYPSNSSPTGREDAILYGFTIV